MNDLAFERPVSIFVGLGLPNVIDNVHDAYRFLSDWEGRRGPAHTAALNACLAAFEGHVDGETVRGIFDAFARAHGIRVPDAVSAKQVAPVGGTYGA